jgi:hypothetical protein
MIDLVAEQSFMADTTDCDNSITQNITKAATGDGISFFFFLSNPKIKMNKYKVKWTS